MNTPQLVTDLLLQAGRLLLEYNESTGVIHRTLVSTARTLTNDPCHVVVSYGSVAVALAGNIPAIESVRELRYNTTVQARVHQILDKVRCGELDVSTALTCLSTVEIDTPRPSPWLAMVILGAAAVSLAVLLRADFSAAAVAGLATGLGLLVRQELGRRKCSLLTLPLTAAFIGALLGGLAIRLGWTRTPELVLVVPAIMLIPGPHLINGLLDLIENYLPMGISRLGLGLSILLANGLGIVLGVELTLNPVVFPDPGVDAPPLTFLSDVVLAGIATCGFAVFYNTAAGHLWMVVLGGMAGHGVRFLALEIGCWLGAATFLGGLTVGAVSAWMAQAQKTPLAVIAFAGAVTMIPGLSLYRALGGALQLARLGNATDAAAVAGTLGDALEACLVVSGLSLGLVLGARAMTALVGEKGSEP